MAKRIGAHTIVFDNPAGIVATAAIGANKEAQGPIGSSFDIISEDDYFGQSTWEKAESVMVNQVVKKVLDKASVSSAQIQCAFAGDLLNQCVGSSYGLRDFGMQTFGIYSACATMAQGLTAASVFLDAGAIETGLVCTSSHFCSAERQYRLPLEYGGQRTPTAQWTATAAGAAVLDLGDTAPFVRSATVGTIEDLGIRDANNMGAAMAPAAAATLKHYFTDTATKPEDYDLIITGDLGKVGSKLLRELTLRDGYSLEHHHTDCGLVIYDLDKQDVHAGASGCGCSASVMCGHFIPLMKQGALNDVLFMATGALLSPTVIQQGESIAAIAHLVHLSTSRTGGAVSC